jgi:hypothetical protein
MWQIVGVALAAAAVLFIGFVIGMALQKMNYAGVIEAFLEMINEGGYVGQRAREIAREHNLIEEDQK